MALRGADPALGDTRRARRLRVMGRALERQGWLLTGSISGNQSGATRSTEISTAVVVPLFSSQWLVFRSSGQPSPGP